MNKRLVPILILFALGFTWGSGYAIARFAITNGVHPLGYTFWQSLGPAILLIFFCYLSRQPLQLKSPVLIFYVVCGLIGITIPNTNMYFAAAHLPASILALVINTVPVMIYPLALITRQEQLHGLRLCGVICAIAGISCLIIPQTNLSNIEEPEWVLIALITPFCFAFFATFINPHCPKKSTPLSLAAGMMAASTLLLTPIVISTHSFYPLEWPFSLPAWVIILEIFLSSLGYVLFFWLIKIAGPVYYSLVDGVVALTGVIWGVLLFKEHFNIWQGLAVILTLTAIILMTWKRFNSNSH